MVSNENSQLGAALANILMDQDKGVTAIEGTPLAKLMSAAYGGFISTNDEPNVQSNVLANSQTDLTDSVFDEVVKQISTAVRSHLSFAKNVVSPVITNMAENVIKAVTAAAGASPDFEIKLRDLPEPMLQDSLRSTVEREAKGSGLMPEGDLKLPNLPMEEVYKLMQTGSTTFDADVAKWAAGLGDAFFQSLWGSIFSEDSGHTYETSKTFANLVNDLSTGTDAAVAIYLLCSRLEEDIPQDTKMALKQYKDLVSQYRQAAIEVMARGYTDHDNKIKAGNLVLSIDQQRVIVTVYAPAYSKWLESGGKPEMLAGMAVTGNFNYVATLIDERREELLQAWNQYVVLKQTVNKNNSMAELINAVSQEFRLSMANPYSEEQEVLSKPGTLDSIFDMFNEQVEDIIKANSGDIYQLCLQLVCRTRFFYTDSEKILQSMKNAAETNPNIESREAALVATIEYVSDFVASQMRVA